MEEAALEEGADMSESPVAGNGGLSQFSLCPHL